MCTEKLSLSLRQVILFPFGRNIAPRSFFPAGSRHTDEETSSSSWKFNFWQVSGGLSLPPPLPVLIWPPKPPSWRQNLLGKSLGKNTTGSALLERDEVELRHCHHTGPTNLRGELVWDGGSGGRYQIWFNSMFEFCQKAIHSIFDSILFYQRSISKYYSIQNKLCWFNSKDNLIQ